jgi:CMP/dCMP kinase
LTKLLVGFAGRIVFVAADDSTLGLRMSQDRNRLAEGASHERRMVIAVDGPSAAGKGTVARAVAARFGLHFLDTGKLYRMVGYEMLRTRTGLADAAAAAAIAASLDPLGFDEAELRREPVSAAASQISVFPEVRANLLAMQRNFAKKTPGAVLDGRDIGTVVCPEADVKLFITASADVRAQRRYEELRALDDRVTFGQVLADVTARDLRDSTRAVAPLAPAADAVVLDTTAMDASEAIAAAIAIVEKRWHGGAG